MQDLATRIAAHLGSLESGPVGDLAAARTLAGLDAAEAAEALRELVVRAKQSAESGRALAALTRALLFGSSETLTLAHRGRIYAAAVERGMVEVTALFVREAPAKAVSPDAKAPPDPTLGHLSLGHKKVLARHATRDVMDRLAMEGDPRVVREVLLNPRLTEDQVVRMVARRPCRPEALLEVWRSPKWSVRMTVRRALALNPYTPPEIGLSVLPHLQKPDLRVVASDQSLAQSLRDLAARLLGK